MSGYDIDQWARDLLAKHVESGGKGSPLVVEGGRLWVRQWEGSPLLRVALEAKIGALWATELARSARKEAERE